MTTGRTDRVTRRKPFILLVFLLLSGIILGGVAPLWSQPEGTAQADATAQPADGSDEPKIEPSDEATLPQQINSVFASVVGKMQQVLFYKLGSRQQTYVEFSPTYYWRAAGSEAAFEPLIDRGEDSIAHDKYLGMEATGVVSVEQGTLDGREVEYFVYETRSGKYVQDDGVFKKALPNRDLLSDDDQLTREEVDQLASEGRLKTDPDAQPSYLLTAKSGGIPLVVLWLSAGAVFFTFYMGFFNVVGFKHALEVIRGRYDNPDEPGEVTHFQALASALSATVGLGNIAGVTIAMTAGGPGAFFWMMACGVFGMTSKFVECTLGQKYRKVKPDGTVLGGPMEYLRDGLAERGLAPLGIVLSILFTVMCILASFGGGNMFQANQAGQQVLEMMQSGDQAQMVELQEQIKQASETGDTAQVQSLRAQKSDLADKIDAFRTWFLPLFGVVFAAAAGTVIIGGIKRIAAAAEKIVPTMCGLYIIACIYIILSHLGDIPALVQSIFTEAFSPQAFGGGLIGVLVIGVQRAAFSNEAGVGSAAIAHSAARTDEPVREGTVALMEPFIDTVVVCSMTALVILITNAWDNQAWLEQGLAGAALTSRAMAEEFFGFRYLLTIAVVLFAFSTLISWSYYGERCWERLFGPRSIMVYKVLFVVAVFVGAIVHLGAVLDFSDMMILSMAFPNILGLLILSPSVRRDLKNYWQRYKSGKFKTYK